MKVMCPHCRKRYNIPDERLPAGKRIAFACPSCTRHITLDLRDPPAEGPSAPLSDTNGKGAPAAVAVAPEGAEPLTKEQILKGIKDLPPMPQVILKARSVMADPDSSLKKIGMILEADQAIAARVLKMANSAYYGLVGMVSSISHAAVVLGSKTLAELITVAGASSLLGQPLKGYGLSASDMWQHSLMVAFACKLIAGKCDPPSAADAFSAGLIHDAGKLVLDPYALARQDRFRPVEANGSLPEHERAVMGYDHAEIAAELCKRWNIPEGQAVAIRFHHSPSQSRENTLAHILHVANALANSIEHSTPEAPAEMTTEPGALDFLMLEQGDCDGLRQEVVTSVEQISQEMQ